MKEYVSINMFLFLFLALIQLNFVKKFIPTIPLPELEEHHNGFWIKILLKQLFKCWKLMHETMFETVV